MSQRARSVVASVLVLAGFALLVDSFVTHHYSLSFMTLAGAGGALTRRTVWERWFWILSALAMFTVVLVGMVTLRVGLLNWRDWILLSGSLLALIGLIIDRPSKWASSPIAEY